MKKTLLATVILALVASTATAATITLDLQTTSTTYDVYANVTGTCTSGTVLGISSLAAKLSNASTMVNDMPAAYFIMGASTFKMGAFTEFRTNNGADFGAAQDTIGGTGLVGGMGISGSDLSVNPTGNYFIQQVYGAPLLVASGTHAGTVAWDVSAGAGNVFDAADLSSTESATIVLIPCTKRRQQGDK